MKKFFTIGEIAQLLNVSAPTLRFWETKGLLSVSKSANLYRQYTFQDLVHIADVIFYRNLGIPIKKMKYFEEFNLEQYNQALDEEKSALLEQIQLYNTMYNGILTKKRHIHDVSTLKNVDFVYGEIPFENVVRFDYSEKDKLIEYTKNPSLYARYFDTTDMNSETRGIVVDTPKENDQLLWHKKPNIRYAVFLIEELVDQNYASNILVKLACVQKVHNTGFLVANYLLTALQNGKRTDYLKAYVEITDN